MIDVKLYLQRIGYDGPQEPTLEVLHSIHKAHIINIPFENLDIRYGRVIELAEAAIYNKVVVNSRGGFCYELNFIFNRLLLAMGFNSNMISARIFNSEGNAGPHFDHMCVIVNLLNQPYLADVGYGDLFITPIAIKSGLQTDGQCHFEIKDHAADEYVLSMQANENNFINKYIFDVTPQSVDNFKTQCMLKQTSADSHFVKNIICTRATPNGRLTVFNNKFITTQNGRKTEILIEDNERLLKILKDSFNITI